MYTIMRLNADRTISKLDETETILSAVAFREQHVRDGGDVRIFQEIPIFEAYAQAAQSTAAPKMVMPVVGGSDFRPGAIIKVDHVPTPTLEAQEAGHGGDLEGGYTEEELKLIGADPMVVPGYQAPRQATRTYEAREVPREAR